MSGWLTDFLNSVNAEAIATLVAGIAAVVSAVWVARRQQRIKEQELRLSLLHERREVIRKFREFQSKIDGVRDLTDETVSHFWHTVQEVRLYFDPPTAESVEGVFEEAWQLIAATVSIRLYREDEMHNEVRAELEKRHAALRNLHEKFPVAIKLMVEKTRVPDHI